ncbi:MAG TPA: type II secretion system protein GspD [Phycisphaerales bacterium]|nr:type II secretion system protein GspD [Phycisphaerales bacterium]
MYKKHINKLIILSCLMLASFITTDVVYSEPTELLEQVGKQDPFEMVKPLVEFKSNLMQKAGRQQVQEYVEVAPELFVESIMLKFLRAENVETIAANMNSDYGAVTVDEATNSLIVCDARESLDKIIEQIRKIDRTPRQILVEVVIAEVQLNDGTEIGVDWTDLLSFDADDGDTFPIGSHSRSYIQETFASSITGGGALRFIQGSIGVTVKALQQAREVEILASPRVLVVSGQQAVIKTIEEIAYTDVSQAAAGGDLTSTKFKDVGITLTVTATLTDDDMIMLVIAPEQSVNTGTNTVSLSLVPVVDLRSTSTTLLMRDGQIVVMGGLRKKETRISEDKIPLLGDLPLIGFLFAKESTEVKHSELLIFVSPHIYKDAPLSEDEMQKFTELRNSPTLRLPAGNINNPVKALEQWGK